MQSRRIIILAAVVAACEGPTTAPPVETPASLTPSVQQTGVTQLPDEQTPFQESVVRSIRERQAAGLPVPSRVTLTFVEDTTTPRAPLRAAAGPVEPEVTITATTVLGFDNPQQAGFTEWPAMVVKGDVPEGAEGYVREGDYTAVILQQIADAHPDAWSGVEYETGPRTYTVTESVVMKTPAAPPGFGLLAQPAGPGPASLVTADGLLMGFTVLGPKIDYHVEWDVSVCVIWFFGCQVEWEIFDFWAGLVLDWTIATRLPLDVRVTSDDPVLEGATFSPTTAATGEDWDAEAYEAAGVAPVDGKEFALEFVLKAGVFIEVSYIDVVDLGVDIDLSEGADFTTPLGPGQMITLPSVLIPVWGVDVGVASFDLGVSLTPQAGSDKLTADWIVSAEGEGGGEVTYTTSDVDIPLGTVTALDGPGSANVGLSGFQYYFNQFVLDLGAFIYLQVLSWDHTWVIPVTDFDLSWLTGGLFVGIHEGTPGTLDLAIPVENVAPTVVLSHAGSQVIHGAPTFLGRVGHGLSFTGQATDPGRDDLTLSWDWNDGPPDPGTTYPVPYDVTETRAHTFANVCLYQVGLTAVDDDGGVGSDQVAVLVTGDATNVVRLEGYWQHQLGRRGQTDFSDEALGCYLAAVAHLSGVFSEFRDVSRLAAAQAVLFLNQNGGSVAEQFDRELLVTWLNVAHGALDLTDLVDTDGDGAFDAPLDEVLAAVEAARLGGVTPDKEMRRMTQMLHRISVAAVS